MDKNGIIKVLNDWNYWTRPLPESHHRNSYEQQISKKAKTGEILFVKGVRRSGKSTLLLNHIKLLMQKGIAKEDILYVNLEDPRFASDLSLDLLEDIKNTYIHYVNSKNRPYIFLDEIQNIPEFEKWLLKEYELKTSYLFATGSNSKLLSKEIGSALSGRYLDVKVLPLGFGEFLNFKNIKIDSNIDFVSKSSQIYRYFDEYLEFGGFPKVVLTEDDELKSAELKSYFDSILLRDIVARYRLENFRALEQISSMLLSSVSNTVSLNSVKKTLNLSHDLVDKYFEYLENAFMVFRVSLFDWSLKKQQANPKKIYAIDTGLSKRVSFEVGKRVGDLLENVVFLQLKRQNQDIYYFKTSQGYEVDFLTKEKEKITKLIQVSATLKNEKTKKRELRALSKASNELKFADEVELMILTMDENGSEEIDGKKIKILNIIQWLLPQ